MNDELSVSVNARRLTLPVLVLVLVILILVRAFLIPLIGNETARGFGLTVTDNITAAVTISIFAGATLLWLTKDLVHPRPSLVRSGDLRKLLRTESVNSKVWKIRARTGSYFVRESLPRLVRDGPVDVTVLLMDPSKAEALASYEALRSPEDRHRWSPDVIRAAILVSLVRMFQYSVLFPRLNLKVGLIPGGWVQSLDISSTRTFLCGQDKGDAALVVPVGNELYRRFVDDFDAANFLARDFPIRSNVSGLTDLGDPEDEITEEVLRKLRDLFSEQLSIDMLDPGISDAVRQSSVKKHHYF